MNPNTASGEKVRSESFSRSQTGRPVVLGILLLAAVAALAQEQKASTGIEDLLHTEMMRSEPDYVVYVPRSLDGSTYDTGNEHFLSGRGRDGPFGPPPAQIPACGTTAPGSCLGS